MFKLSLAVLAIAVLTPLTEARAQTFPARPVHIVVGFPPGLATDIASRLIAQALSQRMGQQFVVDNRPGAGGKMARSAGTYAQLVGKDAGYAQVKLMSGELRTVRAECMASIGAVSTARR